MKIFHKNLKLSKYFKAGAVLVAILIYGLVSVTLNISFAFSSKVHFFAKVDKSSVDFIDKNDPNVRIVSRLFNLTSPGINGSQVLIDINKLPREEAIKFNRSLYEREYSSYVSSLVPLQRHLPDVRLKDCGKIYNNLTLPEVSVVIIFHNEHWSTVLRTVHSVLDNSPRHLIHEVVLVDDASTEEGLKDPLEEYVARNFINVGIIRAESRHGLIKARNLGFQKSSAPVVVFLDSHCECFPGWLEPLVTRIAENEKVVATPVLHGIHHIDFGLIMWGNGKNLWVPTMTTWNLFFQWQQIFPRELKRRKHETDPVHAPAMVGCAIAVSRVWFRKLGMFDPGLEVWGGENTELSLKTWMCGGSLEILPCSNVGHMYHPHRPSEQRSIIYNRNVARVASVWLDKYKQFVEYYNRSAVSAMDVRERVVIRESLKCHPFEYYLNYVHPELYIRGNGIFTGQISSVVSQSTCIDVRSSPKYVDQLPVALFACHGLHGNQAWDLTDFGEIRMYDFCLDSGISWHIEMRRCHQQKGNQRWSVIEVDKAGHVQIRRDGMCVSADTEKWRLVGEPCGASQSQLWSWKKNREPRIALKTN